LYAQELWGVSSFG